MKPISLLVLTILLVGTLSAQTTVGSDSISIVSDFTNFDTIKTQPYDNKPEGWDYVEHVVQSSTLWQSQTDPARDALRRLLDHSIEPFDSIRSRLMMSDFSRFEVELGDPVVTDSILLKWLNDSTFLVDPNRWSPDLYLKEEARLVYPPEPANTPLSFIQVDSFVIADTSALPVISQIPDTTIVTMIDTSAIETLGIIMHSCVGGNITPSLDSENRIGLMSPDSSTVLYYMPGYNWATTEYSPFSALESEHQLDSLQYAIGKLLDYISQRDSTILWINDTYGGKTPFWITQGDDMAYRFWVKNDNHDSISIWVGNPARDEISLLLEDDVTINRLMKEEIDHLPAFVEIPQRSLVSMSMLEPDPIYWNYKFSSVFSMNQTYLSNWSKGGESSFSTMIDILGEATYNNKDARTQWINTIRVNFGTLSTKENGFRKNNDLFEVNSKFNMNAWGKIGMSSTFYMKNQLTKGYNYPNDSVVISKFLNPASLTVGLGFEYKPFKNTTINMAPLSYKNTFVLDTTQIDQTQHGIDVEKKAKQEMGTQIVINNKFSPFKDMTVVNHIRLFSSYLNKPQNVDVDWELILDQKINWFFTIRLNLHLIYDDDIRFTVYDSEGIPVILPDGSEKKVAKPQFKEFIGLSLQFKF